MKKGLLFITLLSALCPALRAGDTVRLSLQEAIRIGADKSVNAVIARNQYISAYWQYRTYKTELLPEVIFDSRIPYYSKSYSTYINENGEYSYVSNNYSRVDGGLSITQNIPWTGGTLSINSSLNRLQQYGDNASTSFMSAPASISLNQPIFGFNRVKWLQRIEPVKFKEAQLQLASDRETVSRMVIMYYFQLLMAEISLEIAEQNLENAKKLYEFSEAKRSIGKFSETELMQMRVSLLNAESTLTSAAVAREARMLELRSFLGYGQQAVIAPETPDLFAGEGVPLLDYDEVLRLARENSPFTQNIQRRMLEASRDVSQAKANRRNISLLASVGMSGTDYDLPQVYNIHNLRSDQQVSLGIRLPLLDWGKGKGRVKIAEANREVTQSVIEKEQRDFDQDIFLKVQDFNNQPLQLQRATEADRIAQKRYLASVEAFVVGKIDILTLNDSQTSKDDARREYISQMYMLWLYYYEIRGLTLHDFANGQSLRDDI